jgi:hypothetical protein
MKINKMVLCPHRLRKVPGQFSWVDQRLVRQGYIQRCEPAAWALYLVLVIVSDAQGLSYYSDGTIGRMLRLDPVSLSAARSQLIEAGLVVYQKPIYQVLGLEDNGPSGPPQPRSGQIRSLNEILTQVLGKGAQA